MSVLRIYEKPSCSTCRKLRELLAERGVEYESIDYHRRGIDEQELRQLLSLLDGDARSLLRGRERLVQELGLKEPEVTEDRMNELMCANPALLQRPIVVNGDRAVLARPLECVLSLL